MPSAKNAAGTSGMPIIRTARPTGSGKLGRMAPPIAISAQAASPIQKATRKTGLAMPAEIAWPMMSRTVSASPTEPANSGVNPLKSSTISVISGSARYHWRLNAASGLGSSCRAIPTRPCLPASRCTIQNAEPK